ncbi:hypothetical protein BOQ62_14025 [Chryseobacterium sp. CH21]|nr:hypothetical protein BOQ62_14025 [Chryseobacterium sp. CH21]
MGCFYFFKLLMKHMCFFGETQRRKALHYNIYFLRRKKIKDFQQEIWYKYFPPINEKIIQIFLLGFV